METLHVYQNKMHRNGTYETYQMSFVESWNSIDKTAIPNSDYEKMVYCNFVSKKQGLSPVYQIVYKGLFGIKTEFVTNWYHLDGKEIIRFIENNTNGFYIDGSRKCLSCSLDASVWMVLESDESDPLGYHLGNSIIKEYKEYLWIDKGNGIITTAVMRDGKKVASSHEVPYPEFFVPFA